MAVDLNSDMVISDLGKMVSKPGFSVFLLQCSVLHAVFERLMTKHELKSRIAVDTVCCWQRPGKLPCALPTTKDRAAILNRIKVD